MENPKGRRCSCPPCEKAITKSPSPSGSCPHSMEGKEADFEFGSSYRVRVEQLAWLQCCKGGMQALGKARLGRWRAQISIRFQRDVCNTWSFTWTNNNALQDLIGTDQRKVQHGWHWANCPLQISSSRRGVRRILPLKAGGSSMIVGTGTHQDLDP